MRNIRISEVTDINRQRFLAELGRLLTFMLEEDRLAALAMYNKLFDDSSDEQALIALLLSPTRQAVLIARAYNAAAEADGDESDRQSGYTGVLDAIRAEALGRGLLEEEDRAVDQLSIFDEMETPPESADEGGVTAEAETVGPDAEPVADAQASEVPETSEAPAAEKTPGIALRFDEEGNLVFEAVAQEDEDGGDKEKAEAAPQPAAQESAEEAPATVTPVTAAPASPTADDFTPEIEPFPVSLETEKKSPVSASVAEESEPEHKAVIWALLLYIIVSVPLTLIGLAVLLVPTFASLALSGLFGVVGVIAISSAFGGSFAVFANVLVVLGVALMLLALSLLFLWLFVWFIVSVMVSLVSGVIALGRKWCYKEVQSE